MEQKNKENKIPLVQVIGRIHLFFNKVEFIGRERWEIDWQEGIKALY